jgi:phosphoribosylformylglycinamidine synthase
MWQFVEAVEGIAEACRALDIPITGGNVSLYNETDGNAIFPTPIIGVVGVIEDAAAVTRRSFRQAGDDVVLLGAPGTGIGGSEYLKTVHGAVAGDPPLIDLQAERGLIGVLTRAAAGRLLESAHDCSDGGLALALAEAAFDTQGIGVEADVPAAGTLDRWSLLGALFSEDGGRAVVSVRPENRDHLLRIAGEHGVPAAVIGRTGARAGG